MHIYKVRCISLCPFMLSPTKHLVKWKKENSFPVQELILKHVKKKSGAIAIKCVNSSDCSDIFYHACNLWLLPFLDIRHSSFEVKLQPIPISIYIQHWQSNKCGSLFLQHLSLASIKQKMNIECRSGNNISEQCLHVFFLPLNPLKIHS